MSKGLIKNGTKFLQIGVFSLFLNSCVSTSLIISEPMSYSRATIDNNNIEFLETESSSSNNLTLAEVLQEEKNKWGNNISIINIQQQKRSTTFLFIFNSTEYSYVYDVVRNYPKNQLKYQYKDTLNKESKLQVIKDTEDVQKLTFTIKNSKFEIYPKNLETTLDWNSAKSAVRLLGEGWKLPNYSEFSALQKAIKSDLPLGAYWTDVEVDEEISEIFVVEKSKLKSDMKYKSDKYLVRPIKSIKQ